MKDELLEWETREYLEMMERRHPMPGTPRITLAEEPKRFPWKPLVWFLLGAGLFVLGIVGLFQTWTD